MKDIMRYIFILPLLILAACSASDEVMLGNEEVVVRFAAGLPSTRGVIAGTEVDRVVCTVFPLKNGVVGNELTDLRAVIEVTEENKNNIVYTPRLALDHDYRVVFYAMKQGTYDVTDMSAITRIDGMDGSLYDAFTRTVDFTVTTNMAHTVYLVRPFAKFNIGTTETDYNTTVSLGMQPTRITLSVSKSYAVYDAVTGTATGDMAPYTYTMPVSNELFTVDEITYMHFAEGYILVGEQENVSLTYTIYGKRLEADVPVGEDVVICTKTVDNVFLQENYNTNIVGNLMNSATN